LHKESKTEWDWRTELVPGLGRKRFKARALESRRDRQEACWSQRVVRRLWPELNKGAIGEGLGAEN
jgi:hypothetical protein